ncbi:MAG: DUF3459 domain-containing protein, partial [Deltaproteobacteria bacterium]
AGMPDLNYRTPAVREEAKRIASLWLSRGVDGFRLDAARHLIEIGPGEHGQNDTPETHAFWKEFAAYVRSVKQDAVLIGENWTETPIIATYYGSTEIVPGGDEFPLNFDFPLASSIVRGVKAQDAAPIAEKLAEVQRTYPRGATDVPFLTNHDQRRVASELNDDPGKLRTAAAVLLTLPGRPFLYYGEEIGLDNGPGTNDEWKRTPMPWDGSAGGGFTTATRPWQAFAPGRERTNVAAQAGDPSSLLSRYRKLLRVRHESEAIRRGAMEMVSATGPVLAYVLTRDGERILVAHNLSDEPQNPHFALQAKDVLFADAGASLAVLPAHGCGIFRLH